MGNWNQPDDFDQAAFNKYYGDDTFVRCVDCEYIKCIENAMPDDDSSDRIAVFYCGMEGGVHDIPDEGGCEQ